MAWVGIEWGQRVVWEYGIGLVGAVLTEFYGFFKHAGRSYTSSAHFF